ncbi:MAG: hypothetical protein R3E79_61535 [Caldilineaceae bacterium]
MSSQKPKVRNFEEVEVCVASRLVLTQGDETQLTLKRMITFYPQIETVVRGGALTVRFRTNLDIFQF